MIMKPAKTLASTTIILVSLGLSYAPLPGVSQSITVVSGSELQEPLTLLEASFEQQHPGIQLDLKFQGSQDIVNNYIDDQNDFEPTILIPANGELLTELAERWQAQYGDEPFYDIPQPIAKTILVAVSWPERAETLFPDGEFQWQRLETAMTQGNWAAMGGDVSWGALTLSPLIPPDPIVGS
jgi:hypothetical protein